MPRRQNIRAHVNHNREGTEKHRKSFSQKPAAIDRKAGSIEHRCSAAPALVNEKERRSDEARLERLEGSEDQDRRAQRDRAEFDAGPEKNRESAAEEREPKTVSGLEKIIENIERLEEHPSASEGDDGESQAIVWIERENDREQTQVTEQTNPKLEVQSTAQSGVRISGRFDEVPNENAIQSEGGDDGEDADKSEPESQRTKTLRSKMPAQGDEDDGEGPDPHELVDERPAAVREQGFPVRVHASAGRICGASSRSRKLLAA